MFITSFISGEIIIRYISQADGEVSIVNGVPIPPLQPPIQEIEQAINNYQDNTEKSQFYYNEYLGWTNHPLYISPNKDIIINSAGIRSTIDYTPEPAPEVLRIALFGDSFTFGTDVTNDQTLSHFMELSLYEMGIRAEVINFGVPAYGADQSYLRWLHEGINYHPDINILDFSSRTSNRAISLFRVIKNPDTSLPLSKPRFYLDNKSLELINYPTIHISEIVNTLQNFATHPLRKYEYFYDDRYLNTWWRQSKFVSYVTENLSNTFSPYFQQDSNERIDINLAIIDTFASDTQANKALFIIAYLPSKKNITDPENTFDYNIVASRSEQYRFIDGFEIIQDVHEEGGWSQTGHYSDVGNQILGYYFAEQIVDCIDSEQCRLTRFADESTFRINGDS